MYIIQNEKRNTRTKYARIENPRQKELTRTRGAGRPLLFFNPFALDARAYGLAFREDYVHERSLLEIELIDGFSSAPPPRARTADDQFSLLPPTISFISSFLPARQSVIFRFFPRLYIYIYNAGRARPVVIRTRSRIFIILFRRTAVYKCFFLFCIYTAAAHHHRASSIPCARISMMPFFRSPRTAVFF